MPTYRKDTVYVNGVAFPYTPIHSAAQNDLDKDAYTNTKGKVVRNRIRHDVKSLEFSIPTMTGAEMRDLMQMRSPVWFQATFFDEVAWDVVTKKMYCSSPTYTKQYIDNDNPLNNIYTDISFSFVEE